jgi:hypothetical protein
MQTTTNAFTAAAHRDPWTKVYRLASLLMAVGFAAVGLLLLFVPDGVIAFFDALSTAVSLPPAGPAAGFYLILAVAYMVVVTVLAGWMFLRPSNDTLPVLLIVAKAASSILSFGFFAAREPALIYLVNGAVDGLIALAVLVLHLGARRNKR